MVDATPQQATRVAVRIDALAGDPACPTEASIEVRFPFSPLQGIAVALARLIAANYSGGPV
jgi:hypothetical protein